jgi:branched-chain amino acid transport system ATP-binding protein
MLQLDDVHLHYGLSHVLQGLTLQVDAGEVVGLFGRNGVGKTTVMKSIAGWAPINSGAIRLNGIELKGLTSDKICRMGLGFVPEDRRIFPGLTVEENLKLGFLQCPERSKAESRKVLEQTYERFPRLKERRGQMATTLSGGEQQMLAMARVLVGAPRLLLIDEPTEGLAPISSTRSSLSSSSCATKESRSCSWSRTCTGRSTSPLGSMPWNAARSSSRGGRPLPAIGRRC